MKHQKRSKCSYTLQSVMECASSVLGASAKLVCQSMCFVTFRARSRSTLPGRFLSRRCFTLCITVKVEPRIAKQYKCQYCCSCKNYHVQGMESGVKKRLCVVFWLTRRSRVRRKKIFFLNCVLGHTIVWRKALLLKYYYY